ncbi:hypothetical protein [Shewanella algae]|uniref:hypothetical protein n=1 Tax=Shewanella algae TaxID=38313 RepID=UPI001AAE3383|nr:hypothetical protein [Shewanella algae]MBO2580308.1 hypothetical protein [Shewanella algae]
MTISKAVIPSAEDLAPLLDEATSQGDISESDFVSTFTKNCAENLKTNPSLYRSYGPWWWALKQLLADNGLSFGEETEVATLARFDYDSPALVCCAAWAYQDYIVKNGFLYSGEHQYPVTDSDEDETYYLTDMDMEALAIG